MVGREHDCTFVPDLRELTAEEERLEPVVDPIQDDRAAWPAVRPARDDEVLGGLILESDKDLTAIVAAMDELLDGKRKELDGAYRKVAHAAYMRECLRRKREAAKGNG